MLLPGMEMFPARTMIVAGLFSALLVTGCGYSHPAISVAKPSAENQQSEDADAGSEAHPLRVAGGVMAGTVLTKAVPRVPREALVDKPPGTMVIAIVIDPLGRVSKATVVSGAPALRPYYLDAVRQWTYKPFLLNGQAVFVQATVTMSVSFGAVD